VLFRSLDDHQVCIWGEVYPFVEHYTSGRMGIIQNEHGVQGFFHPGVNVTVKQRLLQAWLRQQLSACIPDLITYWQSSMGVQVQAFGIKRMKTRWGSCNPRAGRIWLNLNLIHKPRDCLQYVLVHEMVHLLEPSHNQRFYALMSKFLPEWKICQSYLK